MFNKIVLIIAIAYVLGSCLYTESQIKIRPAPDVEPYTKGKSWSLFNHQLNPSAETFESLTAHSDAGKTELKFSSRPRSPRGSPNKSSPRLRISLKIYLRSHWSELSRWNTISPIRLWIAGFGRDGVRRLAGPRVASFQLMATAFQLWPMRSYQVTFATSSPTSSATLTHSIHRNHETARSRIRSEIISWPLSQKNNHNFTTMVL